MNFHAMSEAQAAAARRALDEESGRRRHVVVYLSGSHAYGFPSPDSDVDLKAVHLAPTRDLVGLSQPALHADRLEHIDGIEIDYTSNELASVLRGVLVGNGNYIERILGELCVMSSPEHEALVPLVRAVLSQKVFRHYAGFASSQLAAVAKARTATAKKVLYVLRTALTGTHLLETGELVVDLRRIMADYGVAGAAELIDMKLAGERTELDEAARQRWLDRLDEVMNRLERARDASVLPAEPPNRGDLEAWLLEVRRASW